MLPNQPSKGDDREATVSMLRNLMAQIVRIAEEHGIDLMELMPTERQSVAPTPPGGIPPIPGQGGGLSLPPL